MAISLIVPRMSSPSPNRDWGEEISLLTVGRIEPEKNPPSSWRRSARSCLAEPIQLVWLGWGQLEDDAPPS
jgi:hypothetical protein